MRITVKAARNSAEKNQQEMADSMGIHVQTYRKIEKNPETATIAQGKQISEITGVPFNDIFFDNDSTKSRETE